MAKPSARASSALLPPVNWSAFMSSTSGGPPPSDGTPKHIGGILYVSRGTRMDVQETVGSLARHTKAWSALDDKRLYRLMGYLEATSDYVEAVVLRLP